jgi:hypothetical protein
MEPGHDSATAIGDWTRVIEVAGAQMELTDDYPRRYRVLGFPDQAALDAIGVSEL